MKVGDLVQVSLHDREVTNFMHGVDGNYLGIVTNIDPADFKARQVEVRFDNQTAWLNVQRLEVVSESR